jgi:hypothetical protein
MKLYFLGEIQNFKEDNEKEEEMRVEAEIFRTGTHRGKTYEVSDLERLANNFSSDEQIPIQYDHSESAKDTVGFLEDVYVKGNKLMGILRIIEDSAKQRIKKQLNKKLSISFYQKLINGGYKPHKIREVSIVAFPQVKTAKILFSDQGYFEEESKKEESAKMTESEKVKFLEQFKEELLTELNKKLENVNKMNEKMSNLEKEVKRHKVDALIKANKITPAQRESALNLLSSFNEEQMEMFYEFLENGKQAASVLGEVGQVGSGGPVKHSEEKEITEDDISYFNEDGTLKDQEEINRIAKQHFAELMEV